MKAARLLPAACASVVLAAGCAQTPGPVTFEPADAPTIGALDSAYDRGKWRWVRNPDGRALLTHSEVEQCFVDPQPEPDAYGDPGFSLKRGQKTIAGARYDVVNVYEKRQFWEAAYTRSGAAKPVLVVYAEGRCRQEAERILEAYENSRAK